MFHESGPTPEATAVLVPEQDLLRVFRSRLRDDSALILAGHAVLVAMVLVTLWEHNVGAPLGWWMGVVIVTTLARSMWQRAVGEFAIPDREMLRGIRLVLLLQGLAWGVGAALLVIPRPNTDLAIVLVGFTGLVASATSTMVADPRSMLCFMAGIFLPMLAQLIGRSRGRSDLVTAILLLMFAFVMLVLHRRAYRALLDTLRATARLTRSQQETARETAYLSGLLRSAPIAVAVLDDDKRVRGVNARFESLFGYSAAEVVGRALEDLLVPAEGADEFARLEDGLRQGQVVVAEVERCTRSGARIMVRVSAAAVRDPTAPGLVVLYEDITDQRRADEALRESEARFRGVVEANLAGFCFWERSGGLRGANDELLRIIGATRQDVLEGTLNWRSLCPPEYVDTMESALNNLAAGRVVAPWEQEVYRRDGSRAPVMIGAATLTTDAAHGVALVLDITDRRRAEQQLQWKTAVLEAQVQSSIDGVLVVDPQGKGILKNRRLGEIWGAPAEIIEDEDDSKLLKFVGEQAASPAAFLERVAYLYAHPYETGRDEIELSNGVVLDRYSAPVIGRAGEHFGRIWTFRDITDAKRTELAMREARDLAQHSAETRSMFLANMSHEIRTPMNAILGMIEIVLGTDLTADQRHSLEVAGSSADSLLDILNDVLDFSKMEAGRLEIERIPFDLHRLVQTTVSLLAPRAEVNHLELIADLPGAGAGMVIGDPTRLRQVLTNLIGNAIKFTETGEIVVELRPASMEDGRLGTRFTVRDTGVGIAADKLADIFAEFTQADGSTSRRFGGTGLGLTISQRLVGLMGGRITVTSEPGQGSEFRFTVPLAARPSASATSADRAVLGGRTILVVDDRAASRAVLKEILGGAGARVVEANGADAALRLLHAASSVGALPALAILDAEMPVQDGFELAQRIRSDPALAGIRMLMVVRPSQTGSADRSREVGASGSVSKPVDRGDLLQAVVASLDGGSPLPGTRSAGTRPQMAPAPRQLRILLAEDNLVNQEVGVTMLRKRGHLVDLAGNGREAVAAVQGSRYDVILMDIQMPEMDGFEATAAIRALPGLQALPIIALTAHAFSAERDRCLASGMTGFLTKPYSTSDLFAAVEGSSPVPTPEGPTRAPAALVTVDLDVLRRQLHDADAEDALDDILDTFIECAPERVEALRVTLGSGTPKEVSAAAHALKSSAGAIGAGHLARILSEIEASGRAGKLGDRSLLMQRVRDAVEAVLGELRSYRATAS